MTTKMAYDFGDSIHVYDLDDLGRPIPGTREVLKVGPTLDSTLEEAGYRPRGRWSERGGSYGVEVTRSYY